jgi:hypothetical protein
MGINQTRHDETTCCVNDIKVQLQGIQMLCLHFADFGDLVARQQD